jgi:hypothetical protein
MSQRRHGYAVEWARVKELERCLAQAEADRDKWKKYAAEGWAWLDEALKALGVETVFDIPKAGAEQE